LSDDTNDGFPGIQVSAFIKGDQYVFRAPSGEAFKELLVGAAEAANDSLEALASFKQAVVAKGVFTGDSQSPKATATSGSSASGKDRARDTPPPGDSGDGYETYEKDGKMYVTLQCKHGDRLDLRASTTGGKSYASDFYCTLNTKSYKDKCPPIKAP
jgi:hypothetical protein